MQDFSSVNIKNMIIHNVGNKVKGESLEISTEICDANNEVTNQYLKQHGIEPIDWQLDA